MIFRLIIYIYIYIYIYTISCIHICRLNMRTMTAIPLKSRLSINSKEYDVISQIMDYFTTLKTMYYCPERDVISVGLFTVYFIFLQKYLYNKYSISIIYIYSIPHFKCTHFIVNFSISLNNFLNS